MEQPKPTLPQGISLLARIICLCALLLCPPLSVSASPMVPADLRGDSVPFLPYLEYLLDENGTLDIEAVSLEEKSLQFLPLKPLDIELGTGTFWLRFTLEGVAEGEDSLKWLLSLGHSFPGDPTLYVPEIQSLTGMQQWKTIPIVDRHILNLPDHGSDPRTCYIRLEGSPGLWFSPMLLSPHIAANNWGASTRLAVQVSLVVVMLLGLLRCFSEHGQWRIWTVLFIASTLASALLGLPTTEKGHIALGQFASALTPGLALMLLPHVARHLMRTGSFSRIIDAQLILLTLVGAAVTLLPLVPGLSWTVRFLELWPLGTIFFIPTALWALFLGLPSSQRFLIICMLPPMCTAAGILGILSGLPADILASCPLCGMVLCALMLVAAPNPPQAGKKKDGECPGGEELLIDGPGEKTDGRSLQESDAPLSLKPTTDTQSLSLGTPRKQDQELPMVDMAPSAVAHHPVTPIYSRDSLQSSIDLLLTQALFLEKCTFPPEVQEHTKEMIASVKKLSDVFHGKENGQKTQKPKKEKEKNINLEQLLRDIYTSLLPESYSREIALAWFVPPNLHLQYMGSTEKLQKTLQLLSESAVHATTSGSVHLTVQQYPGSRENGHLLFTVRDTGSGLPPEERSILGIEQVYELVREGRGDVSIQSAPTGTTIQFSLHLTAVDAPNPVPLLIIAAADPGTRKEIARHLSDLPCRILDVSDLADALRQQKKDPAAFFIVCDTLASPGAGDTIRKLHDEALQQGLPFCKFLAVTETMALWNELRDAGFTHAMCAPVNYTDLQTTVSDIIADFEQKSSEAAMPVSAPVQTSPGSQGTILGQKDSTPPNITDLMGISGLINMFSSLSDRILPDAVRKTGADRRETTDDVEQDGSAGERPDEQSGKDSGTDEAVSAVSEKKETENTRSEKTASPAQAQGNAVPPVRDVTKDVPADRTQQNGRAPQKQPVTAQQRPPSAAAAATQRVQDVLHSSITQVPGTIITTQGTPQQQWILGVGSGRLPTAVRKPQQQDVQKATARKEDTEKQESVQPAAAAQTTATEKTTVGQPGAKTTPVREETDQEEIRNPVQSPGRETQQKEERPQATKQTPAGPAPMVHDRPETSPVSPEASGQPSSEPPSPGPGPSADTLKTSGRDQETTVQKPHRELSPDLARLEEELFPMDDWVGEPTPVTHPRKEPSPAAEKRRDTGTPAGTWFGPEEWVGEPMPVQPRNTGNAADAGKTATRTEDQPDRDHAPRTGQPARSAQETGRASVTPGTSRTPGASPSSVTQRQTDHIPQTGSPEPDEWVGEPTPVRKAPTLTDISAPLRSAFSRPKESPDLPDPAESSDEWVGEPVPVTKSASGKTGGSAERTADPSGDSRRAAGSRTPLSAESSLGPDEWVGEPMPVQKTTASDASVQERQGETGKSAPQTQSDSRTSGMKDPSTSDPTTPEEGREQIPVHITPALRELLDRLDSAIEDGKTALEGRQYMRVAEAAHRIANECNAFSLRRLARMAQCVEQASKAEDFEALTHLYPELMRKVEDNRLTFSQFE